MKRNIRFNAPIPVLSILLIAGILAGYAWAETTEIVTYYPTSGGAEHVDSVTVGNNYLNTTLLPGQALIQTSLGIGPGFGNNQPAAPTLLQVQGVAGQASQALFLPGAGGTISLDVAGDLFVRNSANSNNHVRIRGPSDANTAIELRSETLGGTPYIDFANDAATDFDMRIQMTGNDSLAITGGSLGIGTAAPGSTLHVVEPVGGAGAVASFVRYSADAVSPNLFLVHGRGTEAAPTRPLLNDGLGLVRFQGVNTAAQNYDGATIQAIAAANWTAASAPALLAFSTTVAGATTSAERMRITSAGNVGVGNAYAPGSAVPNGAAAGNMDVNDIYIRSSNRWASAGAAAPDFDSGWIFDNQTANHATTFTHNLGVFPRRFMVWFAPPWTGAPAGNPTTVWPVEWPWANGDAGNPVEIQITATTLVLDIWSGTRLHGTWNPAVGWTAYNTGYWRVFCWA